jgi:hypothetical protein
MKYVAILLTLACLVVAGCGSQPSKVGMVIGTPAVAPTPREGPGWYDQPRDLRDDWYGGQIGYKFDR